MSNVFSSNGFKSISTPLFSRFFKVLFYSTDKTLASTPSTSRNDILCKRISPFLSSKNSIVPILQEWVKQGTHVDTHDIKFAINKLRDNQRFNHALEISQWMSEQGYFIPSLGDVAIRLDLISKVHGIKQAEKYFDSIPEQSRVFEIYTVFLNCFVHRKSIEKVESLLQKMRELGFVRSLPIYHVLLKLYLQAELYEKLDILMEEMVEKGIHLDQFTYNIRLSAYANTSNVNGMEKILQRMEADPQVVMDWNSCAVSAKGYIKAGLIDKALEMLNKSVGLVTKKKRKAAYVVLLTLCGDTGRKDELYRLWYQYKSAGKVYSEPYICMTGSLLKLNDIAGAENIVEELENKSGSHSFKAQNLLIAAYCKNGLFEKAEMIINKGIGKRKHCTNALNILATGYLKANQIPKAVQTLKTAIRSSRPGWKPQRDTLAAVLGHLIKDENFKGVKEIAKLIGVPGPLPAIVLEHLLDSVYDRKLESSTVNKVCQENSDDDDDDDDDEIMKISKLD